MRNLLVIVLLGSTVFSCKKDKLEGETAIFNGKWNWIYTDHNYGWYEGEDYHEQITLASESYSVFFEEKGFVSFFENENVLEKKRVVIYAFQTIEGDVYDHLFYLRLNNDNENILNGAFLDDTMILYNFSYVPELGCEQYTNYFIRE